MSDSKATRLGNLEAKSGPRTQWENSNGTHVGDGGRGSMRLYTRGTRPGAGGRCSPCKFPAVATSAWGHGAVPGALALGKCWSTGWTDEGGNWPSRRAPPSRLPHPFWRRGWQQWPLPGRWPPRRDLCRGKCSLHVRAWPPVSDVLHSSPASAPAHTASASLSVGGP